MRKENFTGDFAERSGKLHEMYLLGEVRFDSEEYKKSLKELGANERGYLPFQEAMKLAKMFQPIDRKTRKQQDPTNPEKPFPRDLRIAIADALGLVTTEEMERLRYYTAVGSPLDTFHGIDAFVELEGKTPKEKSNFVTFDITLRTELSAKQGANANVIIRQLTTEDTKKYLKELDEIAAQTIPFLKK